MSRSLVAVLVLAACAGRGPRPALVTTGETSHFTRTGRFDEAIRLCRDFTRAYDRVRCDQLGTTGEGRPIIALHIGRGDRPAIWRVPLYDQLVPKVAIHVPRRGYLIDGGFAPVVAAVLDRHALRYTKLDGQPRADVEVYRATKVSYQPPFEGHTPVALEGA
jgi:hypothetical protein